ncbi:hypothetical protein CCAX7_36860 [Capsulimonas corticalis]|uniref:Uncharacterized protein n=1 Tax=Capsulimonas corticalis TaxID=2219043 RepID=A0A402D1E3_9BACT|nr:prepilin-type N-terminal cleavage/methylation domain-containing protein [Capsulimonas corticalis]BDI31635.1 hypothetical protein CCAX7_36860 [Capsulimonas corticalis]
MSNGLRRRRIGAARRRAAGFTLIELSIVLVVLMLFVALVTPNLTAVKRSRELAQLNASIARMPVQAQNEARSSQKPVTIRIDGSSVVMERTPVTGAAESVRQVDLTSDVQIEAAQLNNATADPGTWRWTVYPDGASDSGGLQFLEGSARKSLVITSTGEIRWIADALPDTAQDRWTAGELQQRG